MGFLMMYMGGFGCFGCVRSRGWCVLEVSKVYDDFG